MISRQQKSETVKVFIRFKPLKSESLKPIDYTTGCNDGGTQTLFLKNTHFLTPKRKKYPYKFDEIFPSATSQSMIFQKVASPMIEKFVQTGVNGTIFGYGQTGSGKTYTICGTKREDRGVIQRTFSQLFDHIESSSSREKYEVKLSFTEIYNNQIRDLTKSNSDSSNVVHFNSSVTRLNVKNESNATKLFEKIKLKRKTSATSKNEFSSRSHFISTIYMTKYDQGVKIYDSEFNIVDLAGNEPHDIYASKITKIETRAVNESLYHLQQVTKKLANPNLKEKISYRSSKLTHALEKTLSKRCCVALIANLDSNNKCLKESVNTLEFATDVASIKKHLVQLHTSKNGPSLKTKYENLKIEHALLKEKYDLLLKKDNEKTCDNCTKKSPNPTRFPGITLLTKLSVGNIESTGDFIPQNVANSSLMS